ncbi:rudiment single hybrid motif-containing protein, partial [Baffinella frigidus]
EASEISIFYHPLIAKLEGSEISIFYDPMIAKLVTWGPTRDVAISTMKDALDRYVIKGVDRYVIKGVVSNVNFVRDVMDNKLVKNVKFVRDVMDNKRFLSGDMTTHFIDEEYPLHSIP